jgi:hypothetical protein
MADAARIAQLESELRQLRDLYAVAQASEVTLVERAERAETVVRDAAHQ